MRDKYDNINKIFYNDNCHTNIRNIEFYNDITFTSHIIIFIITNHVKLFAKWFNSYTLGEEKKITLSTNNNNQIIWNIWLLSTSYT